MAIYEYECPICKRRREVRRPMSESDAPGPFCYDPVEDEVDHVQGLGQYSPAHLVVKMVRVVSRLGAIQIINKRYA